MKKTILPGVAISGLILIFLTLLSCRHEREPGVVAYVIGYDWRECVCCGGVLIDYQSDTLLFPEVPAKVHTWIEDFGFPIAVLIDYRQKAGGCPNFYELNSIELLSH